MRKLDELWARPRHVIAICGGAVSGSEAAAVCVEHDALALVFEQNVRPYGKIEDGLPRWHDKLRAREFARIDANLAHERVLYVPRTWVGRDVALSELTGDRAISAVLLANGAWRDRPLALPGLDAGLEEGMTRGFAYQNAFVHAFNHCVDPGYAGPALPVAQDAIVVGGGLASVDVAKIINFELYRRALAARGVQVSVVELEHQGIPKTLAAQALTVESLGLRGATIYYRRRVQDMPIAFPKDDSPQQRRKTQALREKMVEILAQKYLVRVVDQQLPVSALIADGQLRGLRFRSTELRDGRAVELPGSERDVLSELTVSSIGSVPAPLAGVPMRGELYAYADYETGAVQGLPRVFGLGNVLTGKGNIKESRDSARSVAQQVLDALVLGAGVQVDAYADAHANARLRARAALAQLQGAPKISPEQIKSLVARAQARRRAVGCADA